MSENVLIFFTVTFMVSTSIYFIIEFIEALKRNK